MVCFLRANVDHLIIGTVCVCWIYGLRPNEWTIAYIYSFQWKKRDFYPFGICDRSLFCLLFHIFHFCAASWAVGAVNFIQENEMKANRRQYVTGCLWGNFCLSIFPRIQDLLLAKFRRAAVLLSVFFFFLRLVFFFVVHFVYSRFLWFVLWHCVFLLKRISFPCSVSFHHL